MEERKRILKMVEEGKLTAEEALVLLEQLEQAEKEGKEKANKMITALSTDVYFKEAKQETSSAMKWSSFKEKILDFLDVTVKKLKDFDLDFNFGTYFDVKHIFQQDNAFFRTMDINIANGSVKLIPWNDSHIRIECEAKVYRVDSAEAARQLFLQDVLFTIDNGHLLFSVPKQQLKVHAVIYLPQAIYDSGKIRLFNGEIRGEKLQIKKLHAKTANGAIMLEQFQGEEAELETVHGAVKMTKSSVHQLEVENINGLIHVSGHYHKINLQSFSGSVECKTENIDSDTIFIKTVAGSVKLWLPTQMALDGELKTNIGGFSYNYPGITIIDEKNETIQKWLRFKVHGDEKKSTHLYVDTKTGSVSIKAIGDDK
ncbi:DUF4097 family beta strand repeat-containing protein [Bacillus alveayuensis]|uniref:DUF4097 family beta strand repeat-containing protein n=1 Tax=Aeribacillus alveayuensis TaxID=279215 RepID=UPI0005D11317|nr:DUF4097 domain-containing protein [Bacillus alveayuensis]